MCGEGRHRRRRDRGHCPRSDPVAGKAWDTDDLPEPRPNCGQVAASQAPEGLAWSDQRGRELGHPRPPSPTQTQGPGSLPPETKSLQGSHM